MLVIKGDLWRRHYNKEGYIVIPTNTTLNSGGFAVMGRGLARQAKNRYALITGLLGAHIAQHGDDICVMPTYRIICFPTKYHYTHRAHIGLIQKNAQRLQQANIQANVFLPFLGCGEGQLNWMQEVYPVLSPILDDRHYAVEYIPEVK